MEESRPRSLSLVEVDEVVVVSEVGEHHLHEGHATGVPAQNPQQKGLWCRSEAPVATCVKRADQQMD